jgi:predicted acetyltransferase
MGLAEPVIGPDPLAQLILRASGMTNDEGRTALTLVKPSLQYLPEYKAALERGWSPDNVRPAETARAQIEKIRNDPAAFVALLDDPEARAGPVILPDGSSVPRLPGFNRWLWDGEFCGAIGFRWQPGTSALPTYVLGHIGFAVVPWKRGCGYAKLALALLLPEARDRGLAYVEVSTDPENIASQKVILSNGGQLIGRFQKSAAYGGAEALRFRITL